MKQYYMFVWLLNITYKRIKAEVKKTRFTFRVSFHMQKTGMFKFVHFKQLKTYLSKYLVKFLAI